MVLDYGEVAERGTYQQLTEAGGTFQRLLATSGEFNGGDSRAASATARR